MKHAEKCTEKQNLRLTLTEDKKLRRLALKNNMSVSYYIKFMCGLTL